MTTAIEHTQTLLPQGTCRKAMVVTSHADNTMPDGLLAAVDADVVFIETTTRAYSQAKRLAPPMIILCLSMEDTAGCRLLSMLKADEDTARIPIVTCTMSDGTEIPSSADDADESFGSAPLAA